MVNTLQGFSKSVDLSFKYTREDISTLKMKAAFLEEKLKELNKIDFELSLEENADGFVVENFDQSSFQGKFFKDETMTPNFDHLDK